MIGTILAYATGWLATKWLSWLGTAVGWVTWAVTTTLRSICTPTGMVAGGVLFTIGFCIGAWAMFGFVGYRVKTVEKQMAALWQDMSNKDREDAKRAAEARKERELAEAAERQRQQNEKNTAKLNPLTLIDKPPTASAGAVANAGPSPAPAGVRVKPAPLRRRQCEQGLFGCL